MALTKHIPRVQLPDVTLGAFRIFSAEIRVAHHSSSGVQIDCVLRVPDAQTGTPTFVANRVTVEYATWAAMPPHARREMIRDVALSALEHELDEHLRVDGRLLRNPRPGNGPRGSWQETGDAPENPAKSGS